MEMGPRSCRKTHRRSRADERLQPLCPGTLSHAPSLLFLAAGGVRWGHECPQVPLMHRVCAVPSAGWSRPSQGSIVCRASSYIVLLSSSPSTGGGPAWGSEGCPCPPPVPSTGSFLRKPPASQAHLSRCSLEESHWHHGLAGACFLIPGNSRGQQRQSQSQERSYISDSATTEESLPWAANTLLEKSMRGDSDHRTTLT